MNLLRLSAWVMLASSIAFATVVGDPPRGNTPSHGEYSVVAADFHVHAFLGDGALPPWDIAREAGRRGLDVIVISNHNQMLASRLSRALFMPPASPLVIQAQEVTMPNYHVIALGIRETVDWRLPLAEAIRAVHAQGGLAIAAHPGTSDWQRLEDATLGLLDGLEVAHPSAADDVTARANGEALYRRARHLKPTMAPIGSSDYHFGAPMGAWRTYVFVTDLSQSAVFDAIRAGRTVAYDAAGEPFGDPQWIDAVRASGAPESRALPVDTLWHHLTMATAWLSLTVLVVGGQTGVRPGSDAGHAEVNRPSITGQSGVRPRSDPHVRQFLRRISRW